MQIICEIGNSHRGDFNKAKDLIKAAIDCGAKLLKMQAFKGHDIVWGSQPQSFYNQIAFKLNQYVQLIDFASIYSNHDADLFYSVFSPELALLEKYMQYKKIAGKQAEIMPARWVESFDSCETFISINDKTIFKDFNIPKSSIMYVGDYNQKPNLENISILRRVYWRNIGYSDHTKGLDNIKDAINNYGCDTIEKHFVIDRDENYRDDIHASGIDEFKELIKLGE